MRREKKSETNPSQAGFTLMELMMATTIFLVGIAAIYGALRMATIQKNTVNTRTDQMRSARIALEYLRRDAVNAGFGYHRTGGNVPDDAGNNLFKGADADAERDLLTAIVARDQYSTNSLNFGVRTDAVSFVSRDVTFNVNAADPSKGGQLVKYTSVAGSGSSVNITTEAGAAASCKQYDVYLIEPASGTTQLVAMASSVAPTTNTIQLAVGASNDPFGLNQSASATGNNQSLLTTAAGAGGGAIKRINLISYNVTADGVLVRKRYGNQTGKAATEQTETRELVYGVSDFQIKYFLENGTTVDDPSNGNNGRDNQFNMNGVVQIQISITLAADTGDARMQVSSPITIKEFISTKNLRYEAS